MSDFLKAEHLGSTKWRVLAIPFGGPLAGKDLDGEYFDRETDIKARWFHERPVLFHHGMDATLKDADLGIQELEAEPGDDGWWSTIWLDRAKRYWEQVNSLLAAGKMYGSSGAVAHLVRKDRKTGHIEVWPHAEQTLTPTPANPYARITATKALAGFDLAGIAMDDQVKSILAELDRLADDLPPDLPDPGDVDLGEGGDEVAAPQADDPVPDANPLLTARLALVDARSLVLRRHR